jgi:hypothetical protein
MGREAKTYIYAVIGAGGLVLAWSLANCLPDVPWLWAIYTALTMLASVAKLRLPGMERTFSLNFLFLLYGVAQFSLTETPVAGCAGAVAQSVLNAKKGSSLIQLGEV